jgi:hypothetical protein
LDQERPSGRFKVSCEACRFSSGSSGQGGPLLLLASNILGETWERLATRKAAREAVKRRRTRELVGSTEASSRASQPILDIAEYMLTLTSSHSSRRVIHEGSLLSFPLLSSFSSTPKASSSSYAHTYSSMPMTSSVVSGRRSFGGANAEIEVSSLSLRLP